MTTDRFVYIQDKILQLKSRQLASLIGANDSTISGYRNGSREIPEYIAKAMETQAGIKLGTLIFPMSINDLILLSRRAEARGITVEEYIITLLRSDLAAPAAPTVRPLYSPEEIASSRLNDDPADPASPRKHTA